MEGLPNFLSDHQDFESELQVHLPTANACFEKKRKYWIILKAPLNVEENLKLQVPRGRTKPLVGQPLKKMTHYIQNKKLLKIFLEAGHSRSKLKTRH